MRIVVGRPVHVHLEAVVPDQAILRAEPDEAALVLDDGAHVRVRQALGDRRPIAAERGRHALHRLLGVRGGRAGMERSECDERREGDERADAGDVAHQGAS